jgi:flagellar motor switch protein FliM
LNTLTLGDIAGLHEGKVIPFPSGAESGVRLKVKGRPLYECSLGRQGTNFALCLQKPHKVMDEVLTGIGVPTIDTEDEDEDDE